MMHFQVSHKTEYHYDHAVAVSQQMLHMTPRSTAIQSCEQHVLEIIPKPSEHRQQVDYFGNLSDYIAIFTPHNVLEVTSNFTVIMQPRPTLTDLNNSLAWEQVANILALQGAQHLDAVQYLFASPNVQFSAELTAFAKASFNLGRPLIEAALDLSERIFQSFEFDPDATDVSTPLDKVLAGRKGVCQDFAHLMIGCLRSLGLACRYVSGYILTHPPIGKERLIGADASHAWVSIYCPTNGWVDFDPTNNCLVQGEHITVAWGRDFSDISPMRGVVVGGGKQKLKVSVTVMPMNK